MKKHDIMELTVLKKHETEKAILVQNLKQKDVWIPKSQIEIDSEDEETSMIDIQIPEWLAIDKELLQKGQKYECRSNFPPENNGGAY